MPHAPDASSDDLFNMEVLYNDDESNNSDDSNFGTSDFVHSSGGEEEKSDDEEPGSVEVTLEEESGIGSAHAHHQQELIAEPSHLCCLP